MPPRRGAVRRSGSTPRAEGALSYFQHQSMSDSRNQALPNLPTKQSFAYGSPETPLLPRQLTIKPQMDLVEMAGHIDKGIEDAKDRDRRESAAEGGRSRGRRSSSANVSPVRRTRREPTPDQTQLLDSLRDATRSPSPVNGYQANDQSTATPTPPIPHTISTASSPALDPIPESRYPHVPADKLYPSPLLRSGVPAHDEPPLSSSSGFDNESVVSYVVERDIHDNDLRRTLSDGKNITAPPRRVSGMAFVNEVSTIHEEEEPDSRISQFQSSPLKSPPMKPLHPLKAAPTPAKSPSPLPIISAVARFLALLALAMLMLIGLNYISAIIPFGQPQYSGPLNETGLEAISSLSAQLSKLGSQVSTLSMDLKTVKADIKAQPTGVSIEPARGTHIPRTNFLSVPLGILIDPHKTNPTVGQESSIMKSAYNYWLGDKFRQPQGPMSIVTPWEDVGDCWCSVLRDGMTQITVLLGHRIVPEEVVVEHIPKGAALTPGLAPRDMELWVRFRRVANDTLNIAGQDDLFNERFVLHTPVMHALRLAYPGESEEDYWGQYDELLGPSFYRVGRWSYDINSENYVQRFILDAVIDDPEIRVDKVIIRAKNNWGADNTCIYRLKLFGHK
ncbi:uncharacterized protein BO97DRAFT_364795 [Aspergillus homomorphus CBS 101889]|uniref:SUN domain-containing protein n=1 Tax=Aspergillus homomorphus (strain CBS 101889) TaxID=1450537 RepID=A0A395I3D4_ASPHC|nr:hypothetical protein BO97DRAFT_364795 [Aspergillus homomorphus CBS 101889]RAL14590.1 hypothetical protein BO97DRAFT_364795 [Aspergillus homomorphus CBS 101889]